MATNSPPTTCCQPSAAPAGVADNAGRRARCGDDLFALACNEFADGTIAPRGFELLENFRLDHGTLLYNPFILRYKDDPRFAAFCRKVGLPVSGEVSPRNST